MSDPTIEVVSQIDASIIRNRIYVEFGLQATKALEEIAKNLGKKYFYKINIYPEDWRYVISPNPSIELQRLINKRTSSGVTQA